jgi:hypothetical protein
MHSTNKRRFLEMNSIMERVAGILNLKGHICGLQDGPQVFLHGPADLEGHLGNDGRYYLLDFARLFPPEPVTRDS